MIGQATVDDLLHRFPLGDRVALQLWVMLQASRDALVPAPEHLGSMPRKVLSEVFHDLLDQGYMCWNTRQGWIFGAVPYSEAGRVLRGQTHLTRDGVRAALPFARALLVASDSSPSGQARARRILERAYLATLTPWPEVSHRRANGVSLAAMDAAPPGVELPAGSQEALLYRPVGMVWDGSTPVRACQCWSMREVLLEGDLAPSLVVDVQTDVRSVQTVEVVGIDVAEEVALLPDGSWMLLGHYDQERMALARMQAYIAENDGRFPRRVDLTTGGRIGRWVREENLAISLGSPRDVFGQLLDEIQPPLQRRHFEAGTSPLGSKVIWAEIPGLEDSPPPPSRRIP